MYDMVKPSFILPKNIHSPISQPFAVSLQTYQHPHRRIEPHLELPHLFHT